MHGEGITRPNFGPSSCAEHFPGLFGFNKLDLHYFIFQPIYRKPPTQVLLYLENIPSHDQVLPRLVQSTTKDKMDTFECFVCHKKWTRLVDDGCVACGGTFEVLSGHTSLEELTVSGRTGAAATKPRIENSAVSEQPTSALYKTFGDLAIDNKADTSKPRCAAPQRAPIPSFTRMTTPPPGQLPSPRPFVASYIVEASNFPIGTSAMQLERALRQDCYNDVGLNCMQSCKQVFLRLPITFELAFSDLEIAFRIIRSYNNVDGTAGRMKFELISPKPLTENHKQQPVSKGQVRAHDGVRTNSVSLSNTELPSAFNTTQVYLSSCNSQSGSDQYSSDQQCFDEDTSIVKRRVQVENYRGNPDKTAIVKYAYLQESRKHEASLSVLDELEIDEFDDFDAFDEIDEVNEEDEDEDGLDLTQGDDGTVAQRRQSIQHEIPFKRPTFPTHIQVPPAAEKSVSTTTKKKKHKKKSKAKKVKKENVPRKSPPVTAQLELPDPIPMPAADRSLNATWNDVATKRRAKADKALNNTARHARQINASSYLANAGGDQLDSWNPTLNVRFAIGSAKHAVCRTVPRSLLE
ncbi:hypothetical protein LTR05_002139 [Lithohypha guttulata]|uniref:Uncharacterized protein n=1 Tax=Lithohypha guttulata TaxID=1690604 RepID=A0AAN7T3P5_9EURO|nr:hypothetical protein LTR05_002139 [Lithohypha guttulata]